MKRRTADEAREKRAELDRKEKPRVLERSKGKIRTREKNQKGGEFVRVRGK